MITNITFLSTILLEFYEKMKCYKNEYVIIKMFGDTNQKMKRNIPPSFNHKTQNIILKDRPTKKLTVLLKR